MLKHSPTLCCEIVATCPFSDFRVQDVQDFELLFLSNDGSFQTVVKKNGCFKGQILQRVWILLDHYVSADASNLLSQIVWIQQCHCYSSSLSSWVQPNVHPPMANLYPSKNIGTKQKEEIHPRKLTCPLKGAISKGNFIFQPLIFRGRVSFRGSNIQEISRVCL